MANAQQWSMPQISIPGGMMSGGSDSSSFSDRLQRKKIARERLAEDKARYNMALKLAADERAYQHARQANADDMAKGRYGMAVENHGMNMESGKLTLDAKKLAAADALKAREVGSSIIGLEDFNPMVADVASKRQALTEAEAAEKFKLDREQGVYGIEKALAEDKFKIDEVRKYTDPKILEAMAQGKNPDGEGGILTGLYESVMGDGLTDYGVQANWLKSAEKDYAAKERKLIAEAKLQSKDGNFKMVDTEVKRNKTMEETTRDLKAIAKKKFPKDAEKQSMLFGALMKDYGVAQEKRLVQDADNKAKLQKAKATATIDLARTRSQAKADQKAAKAKDNAAAAKAAESILNDIVKDLEPKDRAKIMEAYFSTAGDTATSRRNAAKKALGKIKYN